MTVLKSIVCVFAFALGLVIKNITTEALYRRNATIVEYGQ